jgi:3-hydroxyisobutyrate dehydrogenase-like beta-hydroxyacid dehydrogenase
MAKPEIGYLGMGIMGSAMAGRLIDAGFKVTVWNRSADKCDALVAKGATLGDTPKAVVERCDIVFACTSDPASARAVVFGQTGVLAGLKEGKKFIDMSTVDEETSKEIASAVKAKGAAFLEAPVSGSKGPALQGQLVILAAGDQSLCKEAQPCFDVMGKRTFFLGEVGSGARMKLVVNMMMGINIAALSEGLAVGTKAGLQGTDILEVLKEGALNCPMYSLKGPTMIKGEYPTAFPLKHQQKDVRLALGLGDQLGQPLPVAAAANESLKAARAAGYGDDDMSKLYEVVKK